MSSTNLNILSLGLGVQSTALYFMSSMGELPRVDTAIFIDLGREKTKTYTYLNYLLLWQKANNGIPILVVQKKNLYEDLLRQRNSTSSRFSSIPAYTKGGNGEVGMLRRQCTNEYKIEQVDREIRALYGLAPRKRMRPVRVWKGISLDEIERLSTPQEKWKTSVYPFCDYEITNSGSKRMGINMTMTRNDIINWYLQNQLMIPPKSSCVFCPYTSEAAWFEMKTNEPEDFADAVRVDHAIRDSSKKGIKNPIYLHESCIPLDKVAFKDKGNGLFDLPSGECSGECHT